MLQNIKSNSFDLNNKSRANINNNNISNCFCVHQNIRSVRKNFNYFLAQIETLKLFPVVIILSEIWIYDYESSLFNIPGYQLFTNCNNSYASGGVAVFVKNEYFCISTNLALTSADIIRLNLNFKGEEYVFYCVYRLHDINKVIFLEQIENILRKDKYKNIIFIGDINIDISKDNSDTENYMALMSSYGFDCLLNSPTRVTNLSSSCIDHIFIREAEYRKTNLGFTGDILDHNITDHHLFSMYL